MQNPIVPTTLPTLTSQADPTAIVFQGKAYTLQIDATLTPPGYFFIGKRGVRYNLVLHPEQQIDGYAVYSVMRQRRGIALSVYHLTPHGLIEATPLASPPSGEATPKRYILEWEDRVAAQILYVHVADHFAGEHEAEIAAKGYTLVNAPRPLPGVITWADPNNNRHGFFFAAGPAEQYGQQWRDLDAWTVIALTNADAITFMREAAPERDALPLDELLTRPGQSYGWIARTYGIPWRE